MFFAVSKKGDKFSVQRAGSLLDCLNFLVTKRRRDASSPKKGRRTRDERRREVEEKAWDTLYATFKKGMDALNTEEYKKDLPQRWGKEYERKRAELYKNYCDGFVANNKLAGNEEQGKEKEKTMSKEPERNCVICGNFPAEYDEVLGAEAGPVCGQCLPDAQAEVIAYEDYENSLREE